MAEQPDFRAIQYAFARHIRDPDNYPPPLAAEDRRLAIYRELFFNNIHRLITQTFPVLRKLHNKDQWDRFIRLFMIHHEAQTPYFLKIPQEFVDFLENEYEPQATDYPFLLELAHYEWVELALSVTDEHDDFTDVDVAGDLLDGIPVRSRLAWLFSYRFPVHRISAENRPDEPPEIPTCLALYRNAADEVRFMELNPVTARLLERIGTNDSSSGRELLREIGASIDYPDLDRFVAHGLEAMQQMRDAGIIIGVK